MAMSLLAERTSLWQVSLIDNVNALEALAGQWNGLAGGIPFRNPAWMTCWWRHFATAQSRLFALAVRDEAGELVGLAPWHVARVPGKGRVVQFLGSGEVCSDYLTLLCRESDQQQVAARLADWLAHDGASHWDLLELTGVEQADLAIKYLQEALGRHGRLVHERSDLNCWRIALSGDWDAYLATLSKSRRDKTRTLVRRTFTTGRAVLRLVESEKELEQGFGILVDLHQKRRASLGQRGCFASERFTAFHRDIAREMLRQGRLRLLWIELEGRPVAVEYGLTGGDTIYYYQGGFDPAAAGEQPGRLCFTGSLRLAIEQGYRAYDFLRGDESYKASWSAAARPLVQVRVVGRRRSAHVRHAAWRTGETVKRLAREGLNLAANWKSKAASRITRPEPALPSR